MERPNTIPAEVISAIRRKFEPSMAIANDVIRTLKWDSINGNYYFIRHGMYHGIELDGYIHT